MTKREHIIYHASECYIGSVGDYLRACYERSDKSFSLRTALKNEIDMYADRQKFIECRKQLRAKINQPDGTEGEK